MRTFVVENFWKAFNTTPDTPLKAFIRCKVEGGYIIEINGEKIFARSELSIPEGKIVTLKPVSYSGGKVIFKVQDRQGRQENPSLSKAPLPDVLPYLALSNLNLPITQERLKVLFRIVEMMTKKIEQKEKSEEKSAPDPTVELGIKILNAAHLALKDRKVVFFALYHPIYGNIPIKKKEELQKESSEDSSSLVSFMVNTISLGKILVNLLYSKGKLSGTLLFEDPEKLNEARGRYEEVKSGLDPSPFIESLIWQWKRPITEGFFAEDLIPFKLNRNVDVIL